MNPLHQAAFNLGAFFGAAREELRKGEAEIKAATEGQKEEVGRETTEERPAPGVILRRTVIEEIVLEPGADPELLRKMGKKADDGA